MEHSENTRVKIPALVHLTRIGYKYLSLKDLRQYIHENTNIFRNIFRESINKINNKEFSIDETDKIISELEIQLANDDLGKAFYNTLINGINGIKLVDFDDVDNNTFNVVTELTYKNGEDEFRPDIIIVLNGMPLSFIEVKKPLKYLYFQTMMSMMKNLLFQFRELFMQPAVMIKYFLIVLEKKTKLLIQK